jgi:hypothetical protein
VSADATTKSSTFNAARASPWLFAAMVRSNSSEISTAREPSPRSPSSTARRTNRTRSVSLNRSSL